jgi:hypothetical protein
LKRESEDAVQRELALKKKEAQLEQRSSSLIQTQPRSSEKIVAASSVSEQVTVPPLVIQFFICFH